MAWTQNDLDKIEKAIATGQKKLQLNGRMMEYQTIGDMLKARDAIKQELNDQAAETAGVSRPLSYRARTSKGL